VNNSRRGHGGGVIGDWRSEVVINENDVGHAKFSWRRNGMLYFLF